jgi:multiple sugar transport system substrate-binding protein
MSSAFEKAMVDMRSGKDPAEALDEAVEAIEHNIARNNGYGYKTGKGGERGSDTASRPARMKGGSL